MSIRTWSLAILLAAALALPTRAALLISEVCFNEVSSDTTGEWIEIFNTGATPIDLTNYKIGDEETSGGTGTTEAMHQFPAGASIGPGQIQIVAVSATTFFTNYGIQPTYEANSTDPTVPDMSVYAAWDPDGGAFNMSNTNDQALILDPSDSVADAASWGSATYAFDPPLGSAADGQSYERINPYVDTNTANDWQPGPNPSGSTANQRSTPFSVPVPEPASFLLISLAAVAFGATRRCR
jgi:hypothetical protein